MKAHMHVHREYTEHMARVGMGHIERSHCILCNVQYTHATGHVTHAAHTHKLVNTHMHKTPAYLVYEHTATLHTTHKYICTYILTNLLVAAPPSSSFQMTASWESRLL